MSASTDLPLEQALGIATTCGHLLSCHGLVTVALSPRLPSDSSSLPWLDISIPNEMVANRLVEDVHRAIDVLRVLAQCRGYEPHKNPHVWEEILSIAGVTLPDASGRAFDDQFPRVRLHFVVSSDDLNFAIQDADEEAQWIDSMLRSFAHIDRTETTQLSLFYDMIAFLSSYTTSATIAQPLQLALALPSMDVQWLLPAMALFTESLSLLPEGKEIELMELSLDQSKYRPEDPLAALGWLQQLTGVRAITQWTLDENVDDPWVYTKLYRQLLGLEVERSVATIQTLEVVMPTADHLSLQALCTALPFTHTVQRVRIRKRDDRENDILWTESGWACWSYAIFHQRTAASSWKELEIRDCRFQGDAVEAVGRVQQGGIPAFHSLISTHQSCEDQLIHRVIGGASVWDRSDLDTMSRSLLVFDKSTSVDAVGGPFREFQGETLFQAVLVPGIGLGYVRVEDLVRYVDARRLQPSTLFSSTSVSETQRRASLTALKVHQGAATDVSIAGLVSVLRAVGSSLRSLDVVTDESLTASDVHKLLATCPNLKSIAIDHDGSYWTAWDRQRYDTYPHLMSVRQTCSLINAFETVRALSGHAHVAFPSVKTLVFLVTKGAAVFPSIAKALGAVLLAYTTLEDFAIVKRRGVPLAIGTTHTPDEQNALRLKRLGLPSSYLLIRSPVDKTHADGVRQTLQLLSTMLHTPLPTAVLQKILAFAKRGSRRSLWIDLRER